MRLDFRENHGHCCSLAIRRVESMLLPFTSTRSKTPRLFFDIGVLSFQLFLSVWICHSGNVSNMPKTVLQLSPCHSVCSKPNGTFVNSLSDSGSDSEPNAGTSGDSYEPSCSSNESTNEQDTNERLDDEERRNENSSNEMPNHRIETGRFTCLTDFLQPGNVQEDSITVSISTMLNWKVRRQCWAD